ncbi:MAG: hypothetical protein WCF57_14115 [Pyrinomonadaceae bacterium]
MSQHAELNPPTASRTSLPPLSLRELIARKAVALCKPEVQERWLSD